jgi:hypothetical protein
MIDALAAFPGTMREALAAAGPNLRIRARDGRFAMVEHMCHLADLETEGFGARIERLLTEDQPSWGEFDGERVAMERRYLEQDAQNALERFAQSRAANVARLRTASQSDWQRTGTHEGMGPVTLARLVELMLEHDRGHAEDIQVLLKELRS